MKTADVKLAIMQILLPHYDMFESGKIADEIISEFKATNKTDFDVITHNKKKITRISLRAKKG